MIDPRPVSGVFLALAVGLSMASGCASNVDEGVDAEQEQIEQERERQQGRDTADDLLK